MTKYFLSVWVYLYCCYTNGTVICWVVDGDLVYSSIYICDSIKWLIHRKKLKSRKGLLSQIIFWLFRRQKSPELGIFIFIIWYFLIYVSWETKNIWKILNQNILLYVLPSLLYRSELPKCETTLDIELLKETKQFSQRW